MGDLIVVVYISGKAIYTRRSCIYSGKATYTTVVYVNGNDIGLYTTVVYISGKAIYTTVVYVSGKAIYTTVVYVSGKAIYTTVVYVSGKAIYTTVVYIAFAVTVTLLFIKALLSPLVMVTIDVGRRSCRPPVACIV